MRPQVVHCVYREALSSVFASQILGRLPVLRDDADQRVLALSPLGQLLRPRNRRQSRGIAKLAKETYGVPVDFLPLPPTRLTWLESPERTLRRWLARQPHRPRILHCRNARMAAIALECRKRFYEVRIVYDCRGAECDELPANYDLAGVPEERWPENIRQEFALLQRAEAMACLEADAILTVSQQMALYLRSKYPSITAPISAVPCCVNVSSFDNAFEQRDLTRQRLGLSNRLVVTYVGSLNWYQLPHESLRIFQAIRALKPDSHFLAITTQPDDMTRALAEAGVPTNLATVLSVPPSEVPAYLASGDVGLLLRDQSVVNQVASPVKFGEYMAAGLPVVLTSGIGDYSNEVVRHRLGCQVSLTDSTAALSTTLSQFLESYTSGHRQRCRQYALENLRWENHHDTLLDVYATALAGSRARTEQLATGISTGSD